MKNIKRNVAVIAAAGVISAVGIGGVMTAQASSPDKSGGGHSQTEQNGDGETNDDASDTGPDANPNEPGHQDASDANESGEAGESGEEADNGEEAETNDDASDTGPDANPNEPGHQDASDAGNGDGETSD